MQTDTPTTKLTPTEFALRYPAIDLNQLMGFIYYNIEKLSSCDAISCQCNLDTYSLMIDEHRLFNITWGRV